MLGWVVVVLRFWQYSSHIFAFVSLITSLRVPLLCKPSDRFLTLSQPFQSSQLFLNTLFTLSLQFPNKFPTILQYFPNNTSLVKKVLLLYIEENILIHSSSKGGTHSLPPKPSPPQIQNSRHGVPKGPTGSSGGQLQSQLLVPISQYVPNIFPTLSRNLLSKSWNMESQVERKTF